MSDDDKKPARKPLSLKGSQPGEVKQTFSHGRTNKVAVEVKRRRKLVKPGETPEPAPAPAAAPASAPAPAPAPACTKAIGRGAPHVPLEPRVAAGGVAKGTA